ncbi:MAG: hypothetical protein HY657_07115 [Acidobacteria bacterium]|nr:hypothetical protein [Acidobacteriota bacterium]
MALLDASSGHWGGYEDPVYRFYHQSFEVYALQEQTTAIVRMFAALAPDRRLNATRELASRTSPSRGRLCFN